MKDVQEIDPEEFYAMAKAARIRDFEQRVEYLNRNIPEDQIYIFAQQAIDIARNLLQYLVQHGGLDNLPDDSIILKRCISQLLFIIELQEKKQDHKINTNYK